MRLIVLARLAVVFVLALCFVPCAAQTQATGKMPRIGLLVIGHPPEKHPCVLALRRGFHDLGYEEGRTHQFEIRWAEGRPEEMLPRFGAELVALGVDLIVSVTAQGLVEAKQAISPVPVVMAAASFPVERGLIASLSHPGGNITGMATFTEGMFQKRLQLLTETLPGRSRVAVLRLPGDQNDLIVRDLEAAARQFDLKLQVIGVRKPEDFSDAFNAASRGSAQALMTAQGPFFDRYSRLVAELALKHKLPSFSGEPGAADAGILMTHGASIPASCHRAAYFVDRILKGTKPADLPVERPAKFDLEINLKTARALGITVPDSVLLRADRVIE